MSRMQSVIVLQRDDRCWARVDERITVDELCSETRSDADLTRTVSDADGPVNGVCWLRPR